MQPTKNRASRQVWAGPLAAVLAAALGLSPALCRAEDLSSLSAKLTKSLPEKGSAHYGPWVEKFVLSSGLLEAKKRDLNMLDLSLAAGFSGDKAGDQSLFKLNLDAGLNKSSYPRTLRFRAGTSVLYRNKQLQEDVTILVMNFDYYFTPWLEAYAFVERFSDTFLSIKERYEVGGGLKIEVDLFDAPSGAEDRNRRRIIRVDGAQSLREFEAYLDDLDRSGEVTIDPASLRLVLEEYRTERRNVLAGMRQRDCLLSLGLALSVFSEMEQAEINTTVLDEGVSLPFRYSLESEQRFRVVLRPNLTYRPLELLTLKGHIYWKLPLGDSAHPAGRRDYRTDSLLSAELKLPTDPDWGKKVSLILEYQQHYVNLPPRIPQSVIDEFLAAGQVIGAVSAARTHDLYAFKLSISF
jgi:hypothetical protein